MLDVTAMFWDIGGVILSNGWDHEQRSAVLERFGLDIREFDGKHAQAVEAFESGQMSLETYLQQTVFYTPRSFSLEEFKAAFFSQSTEIAGTRPVLDKVSGTGRYLLATLNNESAELNAYRIRHFGLTRNFSAFLTSCYLGLRKPGAAIYQRALDITQRAPEECIFIDDRPENLEAPERLGMRTIHFQNAAQLAKDLLQQGVRTAAA
jgi:putative hydrolase of the HAD superfamily